MSCIANYTHQLFQVGDILDLHNSKIVSCLSRFIVVNDRSVVHIHSVISIIKLESFQSSLSIM